MPAPGGDSEPSRPLCANEVPQGQSSVLIAAVQQDGKEVQNRMIPYKSPYQDWARIWNEDVHGSRYRGPQYDQSGNEIPWHSWVNYIQ